MPNTLNTDASLISHLKNVVYKEWIFLLLGSVFSFFSASILTTGWPEGLLLNFDYPFTYGGDGLFFLGRIQGVVEGGILSTPRIGYPFHVPFLDFPGPNMGIRSIYKLLSLFSKDSVVVLNMFFLLSFVFVFLFSYFFARVIGVNVFFAFSLSLLFNFVPFHFLRLEHLTFTWYFIVPFYFYAGLRVYLFSREKYSNLPLLDLAFLHLVCFFSSFFIVYYAVFGAILITASGILGSLKNKKLTNVLLSFTLTLSVFLGVLTNIAPNIMYRYEFGPNPEVAVRSPVDSEIYSLKMVQLFLPRIGHRVSELAEVTDKYLADFPLINENVSSSLGIVGGTGFVLCYVLIFFSLAGHALDYRLQFLAGNLLVLFLFGTIGGLGTVFALLISPLIRGWNRISIFISYGALLIFFLALQLKFEKAPLLHSHHKNKFFAILSVFLLIIGIYDQTVPADKTLNDANRLIFDNDRNFIRRIEDSLPNGSAIYQLPYMPFPETPPLHQLETYGLLKGFLHSKELRWSFGGIKAREGDWFFRALSQEPLEKQIEVIQNLGFAGIYVDRRGYADNGSEIVSQLSALLGKSPTLVQDGGGLTLFCLPEPPPAAPEYSRMTSGEIMSIAGYFADEYGVRYEASLTDGIDFSRRGLPFFVRSVSGLSGHEPWGRWSDADVGYSVRVDFFDPLPEHFTMELEANALGPNVGKELLVKIGDQKLAIPVRKAHFTATLEVRSADRDSCTIEFIPPAPVSPKELGMNTDTRKLGIGFKRLRLLVHDS